MSALTIADLPFIEQVADGMHPFSALLAACGGHDGDSRRRWALAHIARRAQDEDSIRAIMDAADTAVSGIAGDNDVMTALAENEAVPLDLLVRLAWNPYLIVSELAAKSPRLPVAELRRLAASGPLGARCGVAVNPAAPGGVRDVLARDPDELVRARVAAWHRYAQSLEAS